MKRKIHRPPVLSKHCRKIRRAVRKIAEKNKKGKMRSRSYRRDKLKTRKVKARKVVRGWYSPWWFERYPDFIINEGKVALLANTGKRCKCCGHRREYEGMTIQELRQIDKDFEDMVKDGWVR